MAIYHFSAKIISRANGSSALASAAYRSASRLHDERVDRHHDFSNKSGVVHSDVMLPEGAPEQLGYRATLWNSVEGAEKRKDAQLAREVEFAIPREMSQDQGIELARDFVRQEFVNRGMIADLNVHWDIGADGLAKPHAHVMLTMREVSDEGFGAKVRDWNHTELLEHWREAWGEHVNERMAELGIEARIDHRSLEAQGIDLEPQDKIGPAAARMADRGLEAERVEDHREIARQNGQRIIADPNIALDAITRQQATFTRRDLAKFVHRHSDGLEQFDAVMVAVESAPERIVLGRDERGEERFTSRDMLRTEERLYAHTDQLAGREGHRVPDEVREQALERAAGGGFIPSPEQGRALEHVTGTSDLGVVVGYAGSGKSAMLGVAREAWEGAGYQVRGLALSGIAAENLEAGSGIPSRTIASMEHAWARERDLLGPSDVLVIDEAGMVGTRQLERVLGEAQKRGAKVVLVGDPEQLQAIDAGAAFRSITERHHHAEIGEIRRQQQAWQRDATRHLATGRTDEALEAYLSHGHVHEHGSREAAGAALVDSWNKDRQASPAQSQLILTHTNAEVQILNGLARTKLREAGELGADVRIQTDRGGRDFAPGDRVMFLKNERSLEVKNGSLGVVAEVSHTRMAVTLDSGHKVAFDLKDYVHIDHGYAATIHKAQGVTVDRVHVLATPGLDRHATYVALSRHRASVDLHYGQDDFVADGAKLAVVLARERAKDMASDYDRDRVASQNNKPGLGDARGQRTASDRAPEPGRSQQRSIFAGFRPSATAPAPVVPEMARESFALQQGVQRYARNVADIARMQAKNLPILPEQRKAKEQARVALDAVRPHAARDLDQAFANDPALISEAANGRTQRAIRALQQETELRTNPGLRADRFVARWQNLDHQRVQFERGGDWQGQQQVKSAMGAMAKTLERDPQMESLLRNRARELGLPMELGRGSGRDLAEYLGLGRGRGLGI